MPGNIEFLSLRSSGIKELPLSVWSNERISEFNIEDCKELEKLPSSTYNLKVSSTFSLDHCLSLGEFSEHPKDLSVLDLARTSTKLLHISSMAHLFSLTTFKLKGCQKLESLPIGICNLKSLKELNLTGCSRFECFPVILDPMEHLEFLSLEETAIKELHSSTEFLPVLETFQLKGCKRLESLPTSICKLKCLVGINLSGCSRLEYFPEILEPMEHLEFLCFKGTAVKKLPCSIDNLIGLQTLDLHLCRNFEVVPSSIYNLKNLVTLNFDACQELKELPSGTVSLISLEVLNLCRSSISEIPDSLVCSASLKDVNLSETLIRSIPACIKEAPRLSRLWLTNCKMLQSLPELPVLVYLEAEGCTPLKTVSSSRTTLAQGWDKFCQEIINFFGCINLEHNARSNIMADAQLRILGAASVSPKLREEKYDENSFRPLVTIVCLGHEIPNWFSNQNDGSSIIINLPPNWFRNGFLGFALSVVVTYNDCWVRHGVEFGCKYKFITKNGESHEMISCSFYLGWYDSYFNPHHVFVTYNAFELEEDAKYSTDFYGLITEASVRFRPMSLSCQPSSYLNWKSVVSACCMPKMPRN
ncbi:disease resistance protein RPP2B-like [Pyrus x bretschneideri]|uniref:disease resistance protein RPP2B-like n=1 Tax=Pyrus x bretschneideri TaxID=225117 RepID=UPI00202F6FDC|nr:disease resistance protein RPP2B-like [Pyrus x bretschneideri]